MKNYYYRIVNYFNKLESNIAFYPTLISLGGLMFSFIMYYFESKGISSYLVKKAPLLVVNDTDTARTLLTTFIAGLISIMVFSFSMVMILLNQASSNFSPRVLPGLISNSRHQVILGIYNASLLYCIFTLVAIEPNGNEYQLPGFSVLLAIFLMTLCLGAFIYFIHSISQEIQVSNIMDRIFSTAQSRLIKLIENEKDIFPNFEDTKEWKSLKSNKSGYLQDISLDIIANIAEVENVKFETIPVKGFYVLKGMSLIKCSSQLKEELAKEVLSAFHYSKSELIEDNYILAFKQITEIAVKAMSPGINDPGTAINAIDYLTELFSIRIQKKDISYYFNEEDEAIIMINTVNFVDLLYNVMSALRTYCKHDVIIVLKLLLMLSNLLESDKMASKDYPLAIKNEIENLYEDAIHSQTNKSDLQIIKEQYQSILT